MKTIILARVSSKDQEEGHSIPSQVRRLTEYAIKKKLDVQHTFQITESSTKETRKQFDEILNLIKKSNEPMALVTDTVDRLQRSFRETPMLDEMRKMGKLELHFLREGLIVNQFANSAQLMQWDIGVLFASSYVRQLSDNVKRSKEQSLKNGEWTSKAPFGFVNVTLPAGKKHIEIDSHNAPYVIKMFEMYATGTKSFQTIADEMNRLGLKNSQGNPILPSRIEVTLKNTFYYGVMKIKGIYYKHKYPPLISEVLFTKVQNVMGGHNKAHIQYANKPMLLRGLITCNKCGCAVSGDIKKQKYVYYSCSNSKGICKKKWIKEEVIVKTLLETFDKISLPDDKIQKIIDFIKQTHHQQQEFFNQTQQALRKELDQIQNRLSKLVDMHLDGTVDAETYKNKTAEYKNRQREITSEMQNQVELDETHLITIHKVLRLAKFSREIFESSNLEEKQQLLRFVYSNLKLDGETLHAELKEPFFSMQKIGEQPIWLEELVTLRTFNWKSMEPSLALMNIISPLHEIIMH